MALNKASFEEKGLMQGDTVVWMIFLLLCMVSVIEVYSASSNMSYDSGHYWDPVMRHGSFVLVGIILAWLIHLIPCCTLRRQDQWWSPMVGCGNFQFPAF